MTTLARRNPTLLTLLKAGCRINFPAGDGWLEGCPALEEIEVENNDGETNTFALDPEGLTLALKFLDTESDDDEDEDEEEEAE